MNPILMFGAGIFLFGLLIPKETQEEAKKDDKKLHTKRKSTKTKPKRCAKRKNNKVHRGGGVDSVSIQNDKSIKDKESYEVLDSQKPNEQSNEGALQVEKASDDGEGQISGTLRVGDKIESNRDVDVDGQNTGGGKPKENDA